jgi:hypothetical protein
MKLPPALFSTITVAFMLSLIFWAINRAITSVAPPAARPTIMRIGLPVCRSCAEAGVALAPASSSAAAESLRTKGVIGSSLSSHRPLIRTAA